MRKIKDALDPQGILNPGRVLCLTAPSRPAAGLSIRSVPLGS